MNVNEMNPTKSKAFHSISVPIQTTFRKKYKTHTPNAMQDKELMRVFLAPATFTIFTLTQHMAVVFEWVACGTERKKPFFHVVYHKKAPSEKRKEKKLNNTV
jgi:hypothetical protein